MGIKYKIAIKEKQKFFCIKVFYRLEKNYSCHLGMKVFEFREDAKALLGESFEHNSEEWNVLFGSVEIKIMEMELQIKLLKQKALEEMAEKKKLPEVKKRKPTRTSQRLTDNEVPGLELVKYHKPEE